MKPKKFVTYKRLNAEAEIFGFPFMIFFYLLIFTIVSVLIMFSASFIISFLWVMIYLGVIITASITFKKYGIKTALKNMELFFRNPTVVKYNQSLIIEKLDLDL